MGLLIRAYTELFLNKVRVERCRTRLSVGDAVVRYAELAGALKSSCVISNRIRDMLWDVNRALAHAKNTEWTVLYWKDLHDHPDPLTGDYGFEIRKGVVNFGV